MSNKNKITLETRENKLEKIKKKGFKKAFFTTVMSMGVLLGCTGMLVGCGEAGPQGPQGEQGIQGETGAAGTDGTVWLTGSATPLDTQGRSGDLYLNISTYDIFLKSNAGWINIGNIKGPQGETGPQGPQGVQGDTGEAGQAGATPSITINGEGYWVINGVATTTKAQGEQGPQGIQGETGEAGITPTIDIDDDGYWVINGTKTDVKAEAINGTKGEDGNTWAVGTEYPAEANENDMFLNKNTWEVYKYNGTTWELVGNIKGEQGETGATGPAGPQGEPGKAGTDGATWLSGAGEPSAEVGTEGDFYLDTATCNVYQKGASEWSIVVNIKGEQGVQGEQGEPGATGPAGEQGATGEQGPQGETGEQGPQGEAGADGASFLIGNTSPSDDAGKNGDVYLDVTTYNLYSKTNDTWGMIGNIKGADGEDATASEEVMKQAVESYLAANPDLVTVVQDGSINADKLDTDLLQILYNNGLQSITWTNGVRVSNNADAPTQSDKYCTTSSMTYYNVGDKLEVLDTNVRIKYSYFGIDGKTYDSTYSSTSTWVSSTVEMQQEGYYMFSVSFVPTSTTEITDDNVDELLGKISLKSSYILGVSGSGIQENSIPLSALGEDVYTEVLRYDSIYRQAAHGAIQLSMGIVTNATNKGILQKETTTLLSDAWNFKMATTPSTQTSAGLVLPAGDDLASTTRSDITVVGDEIWVWGVAPDDHSQYATCLRLKYDPLSNTLRETPKWFWHNFGHCNAVNYNPTTDSLILGNGGSSYTLENKIYIIYNVSEIINSENGAVFDYKEHAVEIDCNSTIYDFGAKLNVFWTNAKATKYNYSMTEEYYPNTAYAYANDVNKFYVLAFGTGTNQYQYGTYVEPTGNNIWNGTFTVLAEYDSGDPNEEIGSGTSYEHCGQGGDAIDGVAYVGLGHSPFWWRQITLQNASEVDTQDTWLPSFNYTTGEAANDKVEGIAVTNQYLIIMCSGTIHFIPR